MLLDHAEGEADLGGYGSVESVEGVGLPGGAVGEVVAAAAAEV